MVVPARMRAMVLSGHGGLDKNEYREDWTTPVPTDNEVLVRIGVCGLMHELGMAQETFLQKKHVGNFWCISLDLHLME
jgi:D-arabinose 1-dehydrogenase-like Zn-dependent alcohol dehydrogenase